MKLLEAQNLSVCYGETQILHDVGFSVAAGRWLMIVGPNGAGKSTIINAVAQGVSYGGTIRYMGNDIRKCAPGALAKRVGVLAQNHFVGYAFTVGEVVRLGRYAYAPHPFSAKREEDERRVQEALKLTGMLSKIDQPMPTLSGGELQRAFLAQLFAQNPRVLLLDEPTNHLDLVYQRQIFALLGQWLRAEEGRAIVSVVHDLSLARAYGTDALLLMAGKALAFGPIEAVFVPENLNKAYAMDVYAWMRQMLRQWENGARGEDADGF